MDPAWIGLIGGLGGGAIGLCGVVVASVAEARRSNAEFKREKAWTLSEENRSRLERLYETLEEIRDGYNSAYVTTVHVLATQTAPQRELVTSTMPWTRLRMLVNLYFPELKDRLNEVDKGQEELGGALAEAIMESSGDRAKNARLLAKVDAVYTTFRGAADGMREAVVDQSRKLARDASASVSPK